MCLIWRGFVLGFASALRFGVKFCADFAKVLPKDPTRILKTLHSLSNSTDCNYIKNPACSKKTTVKREAHWIIIFETGAYERNQQEKQLGRKKT